MASPDDNIELTREFEIQSLDQFAENKRKQFSTAGALQSQVYIDKVNEAVNYLAAGSPRVSSDYPYIAAEAASTGQTMDVVANAIVANRSAQIQRNASIEAFRIKAKQDFRNAVTIAEMDAIRDQALADINGVV